MVINYNSELNRRNSYDCVEINYDIRLLAAEGFFYTQRFQIITCVFCHFSFNVGLMCDFYLEQHRTIQNCPLMLRQCCGNIPINENQTETPSPQSLESAHESTSNTEYIEQPNAEEEEEYGLEAVLRMLNSTVSIMAENTTGEDVADDFPRQGETNAEENQDVVEDYHSETNWSMINNTSHDDHDPESETTPLIIGVENDGPQLSDFDQAYPNEDNTSAPFRSEVPINGQTSFNSVTEMMAAMDAAITQNILNRPSSQLVQRVETRQVLPPSSSANRRRFYEQLVKCKGSLESRLQTFTSWPKPEINTEKLAQAGFFYTLQHDHAKCFHCGIVIAKWEKADDPWAVHAYVNPKCPFVYISRGQSFLDSVKTPYDITLPIAEVPEPTTDLSRYTCKVCMEKEIGIVFVPCDHTVVCTECAVRMEKCPICNSEITHACRLKMID